MAETSNDEDFRFPTVDEILKDPAYPTVIWQLEPHRSGLLPVAAGRGGPLKISWEIHGEGPIKLLLLNGLGVFNTSWQRQTMYFGHQKGTRYSVLILDNRGMGKSDRPLLRYTTSEMARDVLEVLDHVGWTRDRSVHVCGSSMGGMIAQELACLAPARLCSLNLVSTAAALEKDATTSWAAHLAARARVVLPKSEDQSVRSTAQSCFAPAWLRQPDDAELPAPHTTPRCRFPAPASANGEGEEEAGYRRFASNYARFAAQDAAKRRGVGGGAGYTAPGFLLQAAATLTHRKTEAQLRAALVDGIGRERLLVLHGVEDQTVPVPHGRRLIEILRPARAIVVEGVGHAPFLERTAWFNGVLEEACLSAEKLSGR